VAAGDIVPVLGAQFEEALASASPDVLRAMIREFAQRMMDADVEVAGNAGYGEVTPDRVNSRNGYRRREWDTRAGTVELAIPKLRQGSYFPGKDGRRGRIPYVERCVRPRDLATAWTPVASSWLGQPS
jgi:putative transposase